MGLLTAILLLVLSPWKHYRWMILYNKTKPMTSRVQFIQATAFEALRFYFDKRFQFPEAKMILYR